MKTTGATILALACGWTGVLARPVTEPKPTVGEIIAKNQTVAQADSEMQADTWWKHKGDKKAAKKAGPKSAVQTVNSMNNANPAPMVQIYPKRSPQDAPYSLSEQELRSKIYIPKTFSAASGKQPVILIPGTAAMAGTTYTANLGPLLAGSDFGDPLWVNIPEASLGDAQMNSEYVAYAMNYVQSYTGRKAAVVAWSQGNLNVQWALKYWPSTREAVTDLVAMSPDFHGTKEALAVCDTAARVIGCTPSVYQQEYKSMFIEKLRAQGGNNAYVPTTSIYSATDQIVQPQSGPMASAILGDGNGVPVSNIEIQKACPGTVAGGEVTHEGMLYNAMAFALLRDAVMNDGPGRVERINKKVCLDPAAGNLDGARIKATEAVLASAAVNIMRYPVRVKAEPAIKPYAL
ncbi:Lipase B [Colletotrichum sidae]|uniref:Lipase B n=1 Tax=Colletotrichum sidae TaxID=1347389 RepID=A0A4V3I1T5_9PEZI|nr:Lipase B [Colletotrichum sidae]